MKDGVRTPCFYGLPKIHKDFDSFPPLQPICSGINSCTAKISEFVDVFLKPAAQQNQSYVRDTSHFVSKIENEVSQMTNPGNTFLVTMDVSSLYPNIDHAEGISACEETLSNRKSPSVPTSVISKRFKLILQCNTLKFGKRFFHQIKGTALGTPMACNYANVFMGKFEQLMLRDYEISFDRKPSVWLRYINDIFFILNGDETSLKHFLELTIT